MKITVNGRLVEVQDGADMAAVKKVANLSQSESLVEVSGAKAVMKHSEEKADPKAKYRSIPPVVQG